MPSPRGNIGGVKRALFHFLSAVSLILCVVLIVDRCTHGSKCSYFGLTSTRAVNGELLQSTWEIESGHGILVFESSTLEDWRHIASPSNEWVYGSYEAVFWSPRSTGILGFARSSDEGVTGDGRTESDEEVQIPGWFAILFLVALPSFWLIRFWRQKTQQRDIDAGRCANCSYDLRATPNRCPECGCKPAGSSHA
jgi:hypothetical protein